ncbi:MAG: hypothetical protein JO295_02040 [Verrucomicrobia bacterium]|nr:hypothetical protein [Verrucomicrobiota bacterium]
MDSKSTFLPLFEKIESLAQKLPGGLHKPILQAVTPIKDTFLKQRAPRFALAGDPAVSHAGVMNAIFSAPVAPFEPPSAAAGAPPPPAGWQDLTGRAAGAVRVLDLRSETPAFPPPDVTLGALAALAPDLFLFLQNSERPDEARLAAQLDQLERLVALADERHGEQRPPVLGLVVADAEVGAASDAALEAARARLHATLLGRPALSARLAPTRAVATFVRFRLDGSFDPESDKRRGIHLLVDTLVAELPDEAKLEMARLSGAREAQARIASTLTKSLAAASGALGIQPIPLADMPFLLAFQTMLVSGIIYISGQELNAKLGARFLGSLGMNVGLGMALREGARAAAKLLPGWGNAVSGLVAAAGTYAIGRAATAYYIEGASLPDARRLFKMENLLRRRSASGQPDARFFHLLERRRRSPAPGRTRNGH